MSSSSLWTMNKKLIGNKEVEFKNSWLFTPIALDVLFHKYMPWKKVNSFGDKTNYIAETMFNKEIDKELNNLINDSEIIEDRVIWEMCNQQVFFSKDKEFINECINKFLETNKEFMEDCQEHIINRFKEIAESISNIHINENPYFVFKNSSCDDNVEYWFQHYDEENDEYSESSLLDLKKYVTEFVVIENNKITEFIANLNLV
ncbi:MULTISPECIES: hypothetical protein [unclassified Clostridium]|uniref:hypothetical protein n=1 Tax=unclassified Clostridium TaxID=2614128 RepID=UPI0020798369|nr:MULTISPECIES: hypothetical protein [unclassified Clostridium]